MEFTVICSTKLKIIMTKEEAAAFGIKATDGEYDNTRVRSALGLIFKEAEAKADFSIGNEQALVQLYPTRDGGCEMFITKLSTLSEKERRSITEKDCLTTYRARETVYAFRELSHLTAAARALSSRRGEWDVYLSDTGEYYVVFREHSVDGFSDFDVLSEYAERRRFLPPELRGERGKLLCKGNGIELFSKL